MVLQILYFNSILQTGEMQIHSEETPSHPEIKKQLGDDVAGSQDAAKKCQDTENEIHHDLQMLSYLLGFVISS